MFKKAGTGIGQQGITSCVCGQKELEARLSIIERKTRA